MSFIKIKNLTYSYPAEKKPTLKDISFEVEQNEFLSIVGPSGCGKSTLMMCLNGLIPKSLGGELKGSVYIDGKDIKEFLVAELAQRVQILFQNPETQLFSLNVHDEVAFGLENLNLPWREIEKRVAWSLKMLEIEHLKHHSPEELSSGQKQRVALASLLAMKPKILLLDEPTANLDPRGVRHFFSIIKKLKKFLTVILIEHNIELVSAFSDKIVLMDDGGIIKISKPKEMFKNKAYLKIMNPPIDLEKIKKQIQTKKPTKITSPILEIKNLFFTYPNKVRALKNINLAINKADFVGIIGLNGCGKSTLALNMVGLLKPQRGQILLNGKNIVSEKSYNIARYVGYVFQDPNYQLFEDTVFKEVAFGCYNLGLDEREVKHRVNKALKAMGLFEFKDDDPHSLSVGQKRRITIASILAMKPEIIIIDEPDTGIDSRTTETVMALIQNLNKAGSTIILISHNLELVARYCKTVVCMEDGEIAENLNKFYKNFL